MIVSLSDDCSPTEKENRLNAMRDAVSNSPQCGNVHFDFVDRSRLLLWIRQHRSVMLWVKRTLGQATSGWRPYEKWSDPPHDDDDKLILAPGVVVILPRETGNRLSIEDAIDPMRELVTTAKKAVRIVGLSGVGKTRIVQALFDETIGTSPLDRTIAVYVDDGADHDPPVPTMLERLQAEETRIVMVVDNCSSDLHSILARKVSASDADVRLITVEYDIRDDKPQNTEVVHIEADGPNVAEKLLVRRYPKIGQSNAYKIAQFAGGNARIALAVAERVEEGESLAQLSDVVLFNRLFEQRDQGAGNLRRHAELLSLVYSFSVAGSEDGINELEILGSFWDINPAELFSSVQKLLDRGIAQARGDWRAVLPHAIANRLAESALKIIRVEDLKGMFESHGRERLLMSFAHRLGLMHDCGIAREIVEIWLQPDGILGQLSDLDHTKLRMLEYICQVAPDTLLTRIEVELSTDRFGRIAPSRSPCRTTILRILQSIAYESSAFDRCLDLLLLIVGSDDLEDSNSDVCDQVVQFYQPYLSGTHATLEQRLAKMDYCINSESHRLRSLGFRMMSTALDGPPWTASGLNEFGARPRDYGYDPDHDQLVKWRSAFVDAAVKYGTHDDDELSEQARSVLAERFRILWHYAAIRDRLVDAARALHEHSPWNEGWRTVRSTIHYQYRINKLGEMPKLVPKNLSALEASLAPNRLTSKIEAFVLSKGHDHGALDDEFSEDDDDKYGVSDHRLEARAKQLGKDFAVSGENFSVLMPDLFAAGSRPLMRAFGCGLAKGAFDPHETWRILVGQLDEFHEEKANLDVFAGYIQESADRDKGLSTQFLDQCAQHPLLRQHLVGLHPSSGFSEADLDRCIMVLDHADVSECEYSIVLWHRKYANLPMDRIVGLAERMLGKPCGCDVVLKGLTMRLHNADSEVDVLGADLRRIGLVAATQRMRRDDQDRGAGTGYRMERVVCAALQFAGNDEEKRAWLDAIFDVVDEHGGFLHSFEEAVRTTASIMLEEFLDRVFSEDELAENRRRFLCWGRFGLGESLLARVNVLSLISWCSKRQDRETWTIVAAGIQIWASGDEANPVSLSDDAKEFLKAAPDALAVLRVYASRIAPNTWSGSRADIMQERADAIGVLAECSDANIATAARLVLEETKVRIDAQREGEMKRHKEREQRFE